MFINDSLLSEFEKIIEGHCGLKIFVVWGAESCGFLKDEVDNFWVWDNDFQGVPVDFPLFHLICN